MLKDPKSTPSSEITKTPVEGGVTVFPRGLKPWEDQSLPPEARLESYKALVQKTLAGIAGAFDRAGEARDVATQKEIMNSPETKKWMEEGAWLQTASAEEFCERMDRSKIIRELLGKNFLGAEAWKAQGIDVGEVPPLPAAITEVLLDSDCPFHPGEKIKNTHLLVLIPKRVNGEPYSALKLDELCATRKGSGGKLIYDGLNAWKGHPWASEQQPESEWVLIPKSDPDRTKVHGHKHFRLKNIAEQQAVRAEFYGECREVRALELMTAVLLNDLENGEPRMLGGDDFLRCGEPNASGGRVCIGVFGADGLAINDAGDDNFIDNFIGFALAWKS